MSALVELQREFVRALRGGGTVQELGIDAAGLTAERRLAVYRNHHRISLAAALAANFPTVAGVVGDPAFQVLATSFVAGEPPTEPRLGAYGAGFAAFLEADPCAQVLPYLGDVARLDWAFNRAEQAADAMPLGADRLAALDEEQLAALFLAPHPSMSLLRSAYPLLRIRALAQQPEGASDVSLDEGGVRLMVWRRDNAVACVNMDYQTDAFVAALAIGSPLGAAAKHIDPVALPGALAGFVLGGGFVVPS